MGQGPAPFLHANAQLDGPGTPCHRLTARVGRKRAALPPHGGYHASGAHAAAMHDCNRPLFTLSDTESNKTAHKALFGSMERVP